MSRDPLNIALAIAAVLLLAAGGSWLVDGARAPAPRTRLPATVPANARRVTLAVSGMMCARCSERVANQLETTSGVLACDVDAKAARAWVVCERGVGDSTLTA